MISVEKNEEVEPAVGTRRHQLWGTSARPYGGSSVRLYQMPFLRKGIGRWHFWARADSADDGASPTATKGDFCGNKRAAWPIRPYNQK